MSQQKVYGSGWFLAVEAETDGLGGGAALLSVSMNVDGSHPWPVPRRYSALH